MTSISSALRLFILSLLVFAAAFALRRTFLWDVMPVSWDQAPQSLWALAIAFLLRSIENVAATVAVIALAVAAVLWFRSERPPRMPKLPANKGK